MLGRITVGASASEKYLQTGPKLTQTLQKKSTKTPEKFPNFATTPILSHQSF
jgi:hypothetical protein